jgi:hypothetical protein
MDSEGDDEMELDMNKKMRKMINCFCLKSIEKVDKMKIEKREQKEINQLKSLR